MRSELQTVLRSLSGMAPADLPELLGELEVIRATAMLRMAGPAVIQSHDEQLNIEAAAERLGVSQNYLYRHASQFPFTRRMGRKLLFSAQAMDAYISQKHNSAVLTARQHKRILALPNSR